MLHGIETDLFTPSTRHFSSPSPDVAADGHVDSYHTVVDSEFTSSRSAWLMLNATSEQFSREG